MPTVVITGASAGIGAAAARRFAELGAEVAVVGRSPEKTAAVAREAGGEPFTADFAKLDDVRALAATLGERYPAIDVLANNAGGQFGERAVTVDGHELTIQVNYLAPYLLTRLLAGSLTGARVISTASNAHGLGRLDLDASEVRYNSFRRYGTSKLANILFTRELARRAPVTAVSFHPGGVVTDLFREGGFLASAVRSPLGRRVLKTADEGAEPLLHLASAPDLPAGAYFTRGRVKVPSGADPERERALWDRTAELLGLAPGW
ncbi:SDR family NAD(P)-dependent oxidoreductase [Amycolatopsis sp. NBC_00345]|uniref:SDR family NAD(P)-dependent oxidoreductase n=1 Tax=Amycolatopsis sp. NBC_00345 TaxID=2975955 RepID=UPI002E267EC7